MNDLQLQIDILAARIDNLMTEAEILDKKIQELRDTFIESPEDQWKRIYSEVRHK